MKNIESNFSEPFNESIHQQIQAMNRFFYTRQTYNIEKRIYILKKLRKIILVHQKDIIAALYSDFKKPLFETYTTEI
ncbi:MAG: hypothetical protein Q4C49_14400, partial [Bacillota bacterium]|nr:hypothetical protein [Bacillota bacterium]